MATTDQIFFSPLCVENSLRELKCKLVKNKMLKLKHFNHTSLEVSTLQYQFCAREAGEASISFMHALAMLMFLYGVLPQI